MRKFEESCKLSRGNLSNMNNNGSLGSDKLSLIFDSHKDINPEWLITGKGEMIRATDPVAIPVDPAALCLGKYKGKPIPLIPTEAFAGYGTPAFDDQRIEEYYYVAEFKHADFLIRVKGNSMYPKYSSGDVVACMIVKERLFFQWNKIYALNTNSQGVMIKRVNPSEKDGCILLVSDNEKYKPFDVPLTDITDIALVIGVIRVE